MPPTIVLVHGAFAESASWDAVIDPLLDAGHPVIAAANPLRGLATDAAAVSRRRPCGRRARRARRPLLRRRGDLERPADAGDIVGLVYANGFAPDAGESCFALAGKFPGSMLGEATLRPVPRTDGTTDLFITKDRFHDVFCPDVPAAQAARMAVDAAAGHAGGARRALRRALALGRGAVLVPDRRGGPRHPAGVAALHGGACRRARHDRDPRRFPRRDRLATRRDRESDPRGRCGARDRLTVRHEQAKGTT